MCSDFIPFPTAKSELPVVRKLTENGGRKRITRMNQFRNEFIGGVELQRKPESSRFEQAIAEIAMLIRESPDTSGGVQLRRFLWSLYNMHHTVNLWDFASRVGSELAEPVSEIIRAALAGELREDDVKKGLLLAGEMERWDSTKPNREVCECIEDAERSLISAVRRLPPCQEHTELVRMAKILSEVRSEFGGRLPSKESSH